MKCTKVCAFYEMWLIRLILIFATIVQHDSLPIMKNDKEGTGNHSIELEEAVPVKL